MEGTLRCTLGSQAQHAHSLEDHTRSIQQSTSTHTKHFHSIQQQNSSHAQTYCKLIYQTIHKHATHKTNRYITIETHTIQGYNITLTTTQVQEAIKQYWLIISVNIESHTALWKKFFLILPSVSLAVQFNKVVSVVEHVPLISDAIM